jgi:hypothetical protein
LKSDGGIRRSRSPSTLCFGWWFCEGGYNGGEPERWELCGQRRCSPAFLSAPPGLTIVVSGMDSRLYIFFLLPFTSSGSSTFRCLRRSGVLFWVKRTLLSRPMLLSLGLFCSLSFHFQPFW